jgi:hypothetical protein
VWVGVFFGGGGGGGRVSERCCLVLYGMKVAVSLASVKWYVGMVYGKLD